MTIFTDKHETHWAWFLVSPSGRYKQCIPSVTSSWGEKGFSEPAASRSFSEPYLARLGGQQHSQVVEYTMATMSARGQTTSSIFFVVYNDLTKAFHSSGRPLAWEGHQHREGGVSGEGSLSVEHQSSLDNCWGSPHYHSRGFCQRGVRGRIHLK